jgi:hypothetical protein
MVLFQKCVGRFGPSIKMASTAELRFLAWWPSWLEVGITGHNFGRGPGELKRAITPKWVMGFTSKLQGG